MSTFGVVKAESVTLQAAPAPSFGANPTTGAQVLQPNPDGIADYYAHIKTVQPSPLSKQRQLEAPIIVDLDATPKITHDLTKDLVDLFITGWMFSQLKQSGGTGTAYFLPTARTTTAYTVPAGGALQQNTLVYARGFVNAANNGLFAVGASSNSTTVTVAAGVAESVSGYVATLEVAGFRGASGDIQLDGSGNLISTVADFTTMGLNVGQWIWVGGTIGSGHDFATAAYRGFAKIAAIVANKLTLARRAWTVGSADTGTGKTIDLYFGRWARNVAFGATDYLEQDYAMELQLPQLSAGTTDMFSYSLGNLCNQVEITAPAQNLVSVVTSFIGTTIGVPTTSRSTGWSGGAASLGVTRFNSTSGEPYLVLQDQSENVISNDIDNWKLTLMNHVTPQKQQGFLGTKRAVTGKIEVGLDMMVYLTQPDAMIACFNNTTLTFGAGLRNNDFGIFFDIPSLKCTDAPPKFPGNGPVSLDLKSSAFRDATSNITLGISLFPFLPTA